MRSTKNIALLVLGFLLSVIIVACSDSDGSNDSEKQGKSSDNEEVEIRVFTRMGGATKTVEIFQDIIKEFETKNPNVNVIDESLGDDVAYTNKLKTDLASGTLAHIYRIEGQSELSRYNENGLLMNLDPILEADADWGDAFIEGTLDFQRIPGVEGTYGLPMESGLIGVYFNEELFKEAGIDEFPEEWTGFLDAIEKLKAIDVTPLALGGKSPYMVGHLHNQIFYKYMGVEAAKDLGTRDLNWTDQGVIQTLDYVKELNDIGTFGEGAAGISDDVALNNFLQGNAAMMITGPWNIGLFESSDETEYHESIKVAKFPYFEGKEEYKNDDFQVTSAYMVNGEIEGEEKEYTIELLKMLTAAEASKRYLEEASFIVPRSDIEIDETKVSELLVETMNLGTTSLKIAQDVSDFDPIASIKDVKRNILVGLLVDNTAEEAAERLQEEIEKNENR